MPRYLKYILELSLRQKKSFVLLVSLLVVGVGARLTEPYLYKVIVDILTVGLVDRAFTADQTQTLIIVILIWFGVAVITNAANAQTLYHTWLIGSIKCVDGRYANKKRNNAYTKNSENQKRKNYQTSTISKTGFINKWFL